RDSTPGTERDSTPGTERDSTPGTERDPIPGAVDPAPATRLFRDAWPDFRRAGVDVRGISTQTAAEQAQFAQAEKIPYPLLSDIDQRFTAALRLPVFRVDGRLRHKPLILVVDAERAVRQVLFPVTDTPHAVTETLRLATACARRAALAQWDESTR
ncbi:redoxin domain-containing protein, partial [Streptomyces sp. NPDC006655]|uniref:redoxin domain-containing protein n=1 Tax=Streptomyces sp. NPDC006655 TaxID=3156898 RepID=UPI0034521FCD